MHDKQSMVVNLASSSACTDCLRELEWRILNSHVIFSKVINFRDLIVTITLPASPESS